MSKSFNERRKHTRIYRNFILSYHVKGSLVTKQHVLQVNNVSRGGLNFSTTQPIKEGDIVTIDMKTPFLADSIRLDGVVLECREKIPEMIYEIRLQFQEISEKVKVIFEKIESYDKPR